MFVFCFSLCGNQGQPTASNMADLNRKSKEIKAKPKALLEKAPKPYAREVRAIAGKLDLLEVSTAVSIESQVKQVNKMFEKRTFRMQSNNESAMDTEDKTTDAVTKTKQVIVCREEMHNGMVCTCGREDYESQLEDLVGHFTFDFQLPKPIGPMAEAMYM